MNVGRLYRTIRWLTPRQAWYQTWRRLQRRWEIRRLAPATQDKKRGAAATAGEPWDLAAAGEQRGDAAVAGKPRGGAAAGALPAFTFLNVTATPNGWNDASLDMLWRYNLHYFDYLNRSFSKFSAFSTAETPDLDVDGQAALIERWIAENPRGSAPGWDPYPTSLRIVNWVKWLERNAPTPHMLASLAAQVAWLERHIEWHLMANHLLADLKALVVGTRFLSDVGALHALPISTSKHPHIFSRGERGEHGDRRFAHGLRLYRKQLDEQVLPDGGHYERSVMYHAIVLEDVLDVMRFCGPDAADLKPVAERMLRYLVNLTGADGRIALFNDAADGIAMPTAALREMARTLGIEVADAATFADFPETGYARLTAGDFVLFVDLAPIGSDCQPGHAHADTLTYELYYKGRKVVADTGTSEYRGSRRAFERGTAAHNVVEVGGRDSSEVWSSHRVGARARIVAREVGPDRAFAAHDGYGFPVAREFRLSSDGLTVIEKVAGTGDCVTRVHLTEAFAESGLVFGGGLASGEKGVSEAPCELAVQFGKLEKGRCVAARFGGGTFKYEIGREGISRGDREGVENVGRVTRPA